MLARLLSTENITVLHDGSLTTASFDLKSRTLNLPVWKDVTNSLYDMLVGHEVAHALWTNAADWTAGIETVAARTGVSKGTAASVLNVVEDARIERMIKDKFPGLRRDFHEGYGVLHAREFFGDLSEVQELGFPDRVNLHFKLGLHMGTKIAFSSEEQPVVDAVGATVTWADVVDAALAVIGAAQTQKRAEATDGNGDGEPVSAGKIAAQVREGGESSDAGEPAGTVPAGSDESGADGQEQDAADASGNSRGDADTGTDAPVSGSTTGNSPTWGTEIDPVRTQEAMDRSVRENLVNTNTDKYARTAEVTTFVMPTDGFEVPAWTIMEYKTVFAIFDRAHAEERARLNDPNRRNQYELSSEAVAARARRDAALTTPVRSLLHTTASNSMFTAFDRRKAADAFRRTRVTNSGVLDTLRMNQYRWNENIFRKNISVSDGKNHGIVIAVDWSGSMQSIIRQTIGQLIIITDFCRRAGIPFEVFSFSDVSPVYAANGERIVRDENEPYRDSRITQGNTRVRFSPVTLVNWLSSRMTGPEYSRAKSILASYHHWCGWSHSHALAEGFGMGGTPTTAATFALIPVVEEWVRRNRIQIPHVLFLTDGEPSDNMEVSMNRGNQTYGGWNTVDSVLRDATTGIAYSFIRYANGSDQQRGLEASMNTCPDTQYFSLPCNWGGESRTGWVARDIMRRRSGARIHWMGLSSTGRMQGFTPDAGANFKRDGYARGTCPGWDTAVIARAEDFAVMTDDRNVAAANQDARRIEADRLITDALTRRNANGTVSASAMKSIAAAAAVRNSAKNASALIGEIIAV
jgi:hypothetical protein